MQRWLLVFWSSKIRIIYLLLALIPHHSRTILTHLTPEHQRRIDCLSAKDVRTIKKICHNGEHHEYFSLLFNSTKFIYVLFQANTPSDKFLDFENIRRHLAIRVDRKIKKMVYWFFPGLMIKEPIAYVNGKNIADDVKIGARKDVL